MLVLEHYLCAAFIWRGMDLGRKTYKPVSKNSTLAVHVYIQSDNINIGLYVNL